MDLTFLEFLNVHSSR